MRLRQEDVEAVFCCVGGGGLLAGVAAFLKAVKPDIKAWLGKFRGSSALPCLPGLRCLFSWAHVSARIQAFLILSLFSALVLLSFLFSHLLSDFLLAVLYGFFLVYG